MYLILLMFLIISLLNEPTKVVSNQGYGFVDNLYFSTTVGIVYSMYITILFITGFLIIYFQMRNSKKNRVKIQMKTILITISITFCLGATSDMIFPALGIVIFPFAIIAGSIGMCGMWYTINKHKMMSISYKLTSEYIFEAANEPIFILGEDLLVKNCNEVSQNITGYNYKDLEQNSLDSIINFRNLNFKCLMEIGNIVNTEVDLNRKNKEALICELSATVIYDKYKDKLGILVLLHDVSERKSLIEIQKKYSLALEGSNFKLKNEITERLLAEDQIRRYVYYDALTKLSNTKKLQEDIDILLDNKNEKFAFLFIDLDKFKSANDNYGHQAGDYTLKTVAVRLKNIISPMDTVYRIGGDEFIIILRNLKAISYAEKIAAAALETLSSIFIHNENQFFIGSSIGISIFPEHGTNQDTLNTMADLAMYEAKRNGGNQYKISSKMKEA